MITKPILLCTFCCLAGTASAQQSIGKAGAVSGNVGIQYERSLSERFSVLGQVGLSEIDTTVNNVSSTSSGTGLYLEGRYYLSSGGDLMEGWHIGPYYARIDAKTDNDERTDISSVGLSIGYQVVLESRITAGFVIGGGSLELKSDRPEIEVLGDIGFFPHFGLTVGYAF